MLFQSIRRLYLLISTNSKCSMDLQCQQKFYRKKKEIQKTSLPYPADVKLQALARDAVRGPLPTVPKRVVNFRDSSRSSNWGK